MRLRNKQPVWIANEPYKSVFRVDMIVSPRIGGVEHDLFGVTLDYNVAAAVELDNIKGRGVTADSWFWLNRGDIPPAIPALTAKDGATHDVKGIQVTADNRTAFIALKSKGNFNPLV